MEVQKKSIIGIWALIFTIILSVKVEGQSVAKQNFNEGKLIGESKIVLADETIRVKELVKRDTAIFYVLPNQDVSRSIEFSEVQSIDKFVSDKSTAGMWIGVALGTVAGIPIVLATESTEVEGNMQVTTYQLWPAYLTAAIGAGVGYGIGKNKVTWENVYEKGETTSLLKINIAPTVVSNVNALNSSRNHLAPGISLNISF